MPAPTGPQFEYLYVAPDKHRWEHKIRATDTETQKYVGQLLWDTHTGAIADVHVVPELQRRGIATSMWQKAHSLPSDIIPPRHSVFRSDAGDAWARSVGGELPERDNDF